MVSGQLKEYRLVVSEYFHLFASTAILFALNVCRENRKLTLNCSRLIRHVGMPCLYHGAAALCPIVGDLGGVHWRLQVGHFGAAVVAADSHSPDVRLVRAH